MYVRCSHTKGDFCYHKRQNVSANGFARASCRTICHFHVRCTPDTIMFIASSAAYLKQNFTAVTSIRLYSLLYYNPFTRILIVRFIVDTKQRNFFSIDCRFADRYLRVIAQLTKYYCETSRSERRRTTKYRRSNLSE